MTITDVIISVDMHSVLSTTTSAPSETIVWCNESKKKHTNTHTDTEQEAFRVVNGYNVDSERERESV